MEIAKKNIAIVCNPFHENAIKVANSIAVLLCGFDVRHTLFKEKWLTDWSSFTDVWIVGGDGTLNYFINRNQNISQPLAVFKGGTGNDFHWMLYGDIEMEDQVEKVLTGTIKKIDAGKCNDRIFLNNVGIGFEGKVVHDLYGKKKEPGKTSYYYTILKNVLFFKSFTCTINHIKKPQPEKYFMISVANGRRTGGGFYLAPGAKPDDGLLDVNIVGKISTFKRLKYLPVIEKGNHTRLPFIQHFPAKKLKIVSQDILPAHVDGEYFTSQQFKIVCLQGKFSFIY